MLTLSVRLAIRSPLRLSLFYVPEPPTSRPFTRSPMVDDAPRIPLGGWSPRPPHNSPPRDGRRGGPGAARPCLPHAPARRMRAGSFRKPAHAMLNIAVWPRGRCAPFEPPASRASTPETPSPVRPWLRGGEKSTAPGCPTSRSSESEFVNCCQAEPHETTQAQANGNQDAHTPCLRSLVSLTLNGAYLRPYRWPSSIFDLEKSHDKIRSRVEVRDLVMTGDNRPVKQARKYWLGSIGVPSPEILQALNFRSEHLAVRTTEDSVGDPLPRPVGIFRPFDLRRREDHEGKRVLLSSGFFAQGRVHSQIGLLS